MYNNFPYQAGKFLMPLAEKEKGEDSPYSTAERRVPELMLVLGSQPAGDVESYTWR